MRRLLRLAAVLTIAGCDVPPPPTVEAIPGEVAPAYHSPADRWRVEHPLYIEEGVVAVGECLKCHVPENSCNRCHAYVGTRLIP